MKRKRRHLTAEFKARVALEAIKGEKTADEIAQENDIAPRRSANGRSSSRTAWRSVREQGRALQELQPRRGSEARLERKIGQLVIEKDFLEKKCEQLGIDPSEKP